MVARLNQCEIVPCMIYRGDFLHGKMKQNRIKTEMSKLKGKINEIYAKLKINEKYSYPVLHSHIVLLWENFIL